MRTEPSAISAAGPSAACSSDKPTGRMLMPAPNEPGAVPGARAERRRNKDDSSGVVIYALVIAVVSAIIVTIVMVAH